MQDCHGRTRRCGVRRLASRGWSSTGGTFGGIESVETTVVGDLGLDVCFEPEVILADEIAGRPVLADEEDALEAIGAVTVGPATADGLCALPDQLGEMTCGLGEARRVARVKVIHGALVAPGLDRGRDVGVAARQVLTVLVVLRVSPHAQRRVLLRVFRQRRVPVQVRRRVLIPVQVRLVEHRRSKILRRCVLRRQRRGRRCLRVVFCDRRRHDMHRLCLRR